MKLTPRSMAWLSAAREVLSSVDPQSFPPIPHAPKPIADIFQPVRPKARYSMFSILSAKIVSLPVVYSNGMAFCKKRGTAGDHKGPPISINLRKSSSTSVGAREVRSGGEGLY